MSTRYRTIVADPPWAVRGDARAAERHRELLMRRPTLRQVQDDPTRLRGLGPLSLAHLTHEAEAEDDDVTFLAIQNEIERQAQTLDAGKKWPDTTGYLVRQSYNDAYRQTWPEHAGPHGAGGAA